MLRAKKMQMHRLMLYAARSVVPKNQQTETARYLLQYNCFPPPVFLFTISMLQILGYLYYVVKLNSGFSIEKPVPIKSIFILDPYRKHEIWRYFTYMFVHVGYNFYAAIEMKRNQTSFQLHALAHQPDGSDISRHSA